MPLYEYVCRACGEELERLQKISDPPLTDCPVCSKPELVKKVSAAAFRLKGSGWYETDFKSGQRRNVIGDSSGDAKKESKSSGGDGAKTSEAKGKDSGSSEKSSSKSSQGTAAAS